MSEADAATSVNVAEKLGFKAGDLIQEFGYDDDVDFDLRDDIEDLTGSELFDEDDHEVVDAAILWWRAGDGDLVDALVDSLVSLTEGGVVWILTPEVRPDRLRVAVGHPGCGTHRRIARHHVRRGFPGLERHPAGYPEEQVTATCAAARRPAARRAAPFRQWGRQRRTSSWSTSSANPCGSRTSVAGTSSLSFTRSPFPGSAPANCARSATTSPFLRTADATVLAISVDSKFAQRAYAEQENYGFDLLADFWPHGAVAGQYGVFDAESGMAKRGTFILDAAGIVRYVVVNPRGQARDFNGYRAALAAIGGS